MAVVRNSSDNLNIVINCLERNPDFFLENPELLSKLRVPHITGENIHSFIEYQVASLKKHNQSLNSTIENLQSDQQTIFDLSEAVQQQVDKTLNADTAEGLYDDFSKFLTKYYQVNQFLFFMFVDERPRSDYKGLKFKPTHSKLQSLFSELFNRNKPLCDSLQAEYLEGLFGSKANNVSSTVAFPVQTDDHLGLMVLASQEKDIYEQGLALNLLNQLKSVFAYQLNNVLNI